MTIKLHWFLPTSGDSRTVVPFGPDGHHRAPTLDHLIRVAQAADHLGFEGVLTPTGTWCEDAWIVTSALMTQTRRLKFLVAFRPGAVTPTLAAQQATTFQRLSGGRLLLNIVTGGDVAEQRRFGDWLDHDERYDRTDEFLHVLRGALAGRRIDFDGRYYRVEGATVSGTASPTQLYFGGASPAAELVAAKHVDVYLTWGEPPSMVAPRLARMRQLAAEHGRELRFGIRLHTITRDTAADAWRETDRFLEQLPDELVDRAQRSLAGSQSIGQQRMRALHNGSRESLTISPNLWAGYGLVRGGAATTLVGSHADVAERIEEYHQLGFDEFILSGHPHLEEAHWFAEGVMPILRRRGLIDGIAGDHDQQARTVAYAPLNAR